MKYDVIIVGAGPGGIFTAYELAKLAPEMRIAVFECGNPLEKRRCPIDGDRIKSCVKCKSCAIMNGFGGAGAFSDGKYNITNQFGGTLHEFIGKDKALELMRSRPPYAISAPTRTTSCCRICTICSRTGSTSCSTPTSTLSKSSTTATA